MGLNGGFAKHFVSDIGKQTETSRHHVAGVL